MANSKLERDLPFIEDNWKVFISLVKDEITSEYDSLQEFELQYKKYSRLDKIVHYSENNIGFILEQKEFFIELDESLESKFNILEAFKRRNNLDNDIALSTYKSIVEKGTVKKALAKLSDTKANIDYTKDYINRLKDLVNGEVYNFDLITELTSKYDLDSQAKNAILIYPVIKSARLNVKAINKEEELGLEEKQSYRYLFDIQKERYNKLISERKELLDKYYNIISGMSPLVSTTYRGFIKLSETELDEIPDEYFGKDYPECKSTISAMQVFDTKSEIESLIENIVTNDYTNAEDIEFLNEYIDTFDNELKKLELLDEKVVIIDKTNDINLDDKKVFFLTDEEGKPFISEDTTNDHSKSLVNLINKGDQGLTARKKGSNVKHLLGKKIEEIERKLDKTVFMLINGQIIVSYVKVNLENKEENNEGIVIITSCGVHPNTIVENTADVINKNLDWVVTQIASIEALDKKQMKLQESVRKSIMDNTVETIEEVDLSGTKAK